MSFQSLLEDINEKPDVFSSAKTLKVNKKYRVMKLQKLDTVHGQAIVAHLPEEAVFLPRRMVEKITPMFEDFCEKIEEIPVYIIRPEEGKANYIPLEFTTESDEEPKRKKRKANE